MRVLVCVVVESGMLAVEPVVTSFRYDSVMTSEVVSQNMMYWFSKMFVTVAQDGASLWLKPVENSSVSTTRFRLWLGLNDLNRDW